VVHTNRSEIMQMRPVISDYDTNVLLIQIDWMKLTLQQPLHLHLARPGCTPAMLIGQPGMDWQCPNWYECGAIDSLWQYPTQMLIDGLGGSQRHKRYQPKCPLHQYRLELGTSDLQVTPVIESVNSATCWLPTRLIADAQSIATDE
jgi:hypothetical protein